MQWSADLFNAAQEAGVHKILLPNLITDLSEREREETAKNVPEWLKGKWTPSDWPMVGMVTDRAADRYGEPLVRAGGLPIALYPTVAETERWLIQSNGRYKDSR
jgi:hypothetical protein